MQKPTHGPDHDEFSSFALSEEGISHAEMLATSAFAHFTNSVEIARLDPAIAAIFLAADLLAAAEHYTGEPPEVIIARFRYLIDERRADHDRDEQEEQADPDSLPLLSTALH